MNICYLAFPDSNSGKYIILYREIVIHDEHFHFESFESEISALVNNPNPNPHSNLCRLLHILIFYAAKTPMFLTKYESHNKFSTYLFGFRTL